MADPRSLTYRSALGSRAVESADQSVMFTLVRYFRHYWTHMVSVILYPILFAASLFQTVFAWQDAYLAKKKDGVGDVNLFVKAGVYTVSTLALGVSLFAAFAASVGSVLVAPILMCAGYALKALYHLGSAIYNTVNYLSAKTPEARTTYKEKAKDDLAIGLTTGLIAIGLGIGLFLHKATFGLLGVVGGFVGAIYCGYKAIASHRSKTKAASLEASPEVSPKADITNNAQMRLALGLSNTQTVTQTNAGELSADERSIITTYRPQLTATDKPADQATTILPTDNTGVGQQDLTLMSPSP